MAASKINIQVSADYNNKDIDRAIKDLNSLKTGAGGGKPEMDGFSASLKNLAIAAGGLYALKEIAGFLNDSVQAAMADEAELTKLNTTLSNLGFGARATELAAWVDQLQYTANVSESVLRPALQSLVTSTKNVDQAQGLMQLALDLSASGFGSVQDAANALSKAISTGTVSRLNAFTKGAIDPAIIKSKDLDGAIRQLGDTFGGAALAKSKTLQSRIEGLGIAAGELKESFGQGIIDGFIKSLGGGADSIDDAEQSMRDMQTTATNLGNAIGQLGGWALQGFEIIRGTVVTVVYQMVQSLNSLYNAYIDIADALGIMSDAEADQERLRQGAIMEAQKLAYYEDLLGYKFGETAAATDTATASAAGFTAGMDTASTAAEESATAATALLDATKALDAQWAVKESRFAFLDYLDTVNGKFDKGSKSLDAHTSAGRTNQRVLMDGYSTLTTSVQKWAEETDASQAEVNVKMATGVAALRKKWENSGLSKADIDKWLGKNTAWDPGLAALVLKANAMGIDIGEALGDGSIEGLRGRIGAMQAMATTAVNKMTAAAKNAGLIQSPSKVWYEIGMNLGDGLKNGLAVSWPRIAEEVTKGVTGLSILIEGEGLKLSDKLLQGFAARAEGFKAVIDQQVEIIKSARQALDDYAKSVTSTVMGNIDFSSTKPDGKPMSPEEWVTSIFGSIESQGNLVAAVAKVTGLVPEAIQQQLLTMAPAQGIAFANFLADPANSALLEKLNWNYAGLATFTQNALGIPMAAAFATVGGKSATDMIAQAKKKIAAESAEFQKWVQTHLNTTITIKVKYDTSDAPGRALGGPVTASSPYIVGENGPELFVPWKNGNIVPNGDLPTAAGSYGSSRSSGPTYVVNVAAGVGDPRAIGQQVVEYIKRFEAASGPVFVGA